MLPAAALRATARGSRRATEATRATATARRAPMKPTTPEGYRRYLGGFFGDLVVVVGRDRAALRHEGRLQALRDRLLGDHALGHVSAGRELEHHVEQRALDDRAQAAGAGLALERALGDLRQAVLRED